MDTAANSSVASWRTRWSSAIRRREQHVFLALTLVIGALVGLLVVAFILMTEHFGLRLYPMGGARWRGLVTPAIGSLAMGYLLYRYFPNARGSGVPQTKAALYAHEGFISLRTVLGKFFCTSATLACGIPLGREGPSVQVGAGVASVLGRRLGLSPERVKALLPVGAAAAIAAAFNTPIAAVLFTLEEVMGDLHAPVLGSVVLASATSWITLRLLLGNEPLFHVPQYELVHPVEFAAYAVLGVLGGVGSAVFTKLLLGIRARFLRMSSKTLPYQPLAGGLAVGAMGWFIPQVLGVGYGVVGAALNGNMGLRLMALLVVLKTVAVAVSYGSGNAGGIFGPSLFIGAMLGGTVGTVAHHLLPGFTAAPGAYALVGMGAAFAGIVRAPMTSVMMIFETTRDYSVVVPLMISNLLSFFVSMKLQRQPIYEALAAQDGIHLPARMAEARVAEVMRPRAAAEALPTNLTAREALEKTRGSEFHSWLVIDEKGVLGIIPESGLQQAVADGAGAKNVANLTASLILEHVHKDQPLHFALERMGAAGVDTLPVVSRANTRNLEGIVTLADVLKTYGFRGLPSQETRQ